MSFPFLPNIMLNALTDITVEMLRQKGIRLLMLDFDNTIVPYTTSVPTQQMIEWISVMKESDVHICVVSNSRKERVKLFCDKYGIPCIIHAKKPFSKGILECLEQFDVPACEAAIAGDQIYTDTLGGNWCGLFTILIKAIDNHNVWLKLRHVAELPFIFYAGKRRN